MTDHGEKLSEISPKELTDRLKDESDSKAIKRLVVAREYLDVQSPATISEKFGWPEQTIYSWINRLESRGLDKGLNDDIPPRRPPALGDDEFEEFQAAVQGPPGNVGFDTSIWSTELAQRHLRDEFGQKYSLRHVRRLLTRAGISWPISSPQSQTGDEREGD